MKLRSVSMGVILELPKVGDIIEKGQTIYALEIMKTIYPIESNHQYKVVEVYVKIEDLVEKGQELMRIELVG